MSNGHKMEFIVGEDVTYLNYWDWLSGVNDTVFHLRNGKAYREDENGAEIEVDLARELGLLAKRVDAQVKFFYEEKDKRK